ncbi:SMI1-KNR4 cell-wall [Corynebacterium mustelae]|uniref:SMI1-KNR4 cell-wall n=2 Tax=Corynebacterium mustelae TaxID=571915 RepID=A0A0G3GXF4_9CORY|nr:SMI1-KNR4 cell-wall [Corynebacterium mustelae]
MAVGLKSKNMSDGNLEHYSQVKQLIAKLPAETTFHPSKVQLEWVTEAEAKSKVRLPESFRRFVLEYDTIKLQGYWTFTVAPPEFSDDYPEDIFTFYRNSSEGNPTEYDKLLFLVTGEGDECYFFPVIEGKALDKVYVADAFSPEFCTPYADSFYEFLVTEIPRSYPECFRH